MSLRTGKYGPAVFAVIFLVCTTVTMAQVKTKTTEQQGRTMKEVTVERGEVVYVAGNDLVIRMENGEIRHLTVPDGAKATVNGREYTVADLRPGMKLERTITTTTTQKMVKTVKTGTGTVLNVMPPLSVIVQFEDGSVQQYQVPKGTKFNIEGQEKTVFDLRKGMKITATRISEEPVVEVKTGAQVTGVTPPPPVPPQEVPLLIAAPAAAPAPTPERAPATERPPATERAPAKLPATGSAVPLIGLLGLLFSGASLAVRRLRRS